VVRGRAAEGDFVPVITNAVISSSGWWNVDDVHTVTLEQAMTGLEVGCWVEMRGFVRRVVNEGALTCLDMSTSSGEFKVRTPASQPYDYLKGAIIRVQGVCEAVTDVKHRLVGIQVLSPEVKYLTVEEPAPDDMFAVPLRTMDSLRRFNAQNVLNQRVRTVGTVVLQAQGRHFYLQDGDESVFALSQQPGTLHPGDRIEVVGLAGTEGRRFLLREAAFRFLSAGQEPAPIQLSATHSVNEDLEGLLVTANGILLNSVNEDGDTHLLIHSRDSAFAATLAGTARQATNALPKYQVGSKLALNGVYEIQSDDYGKPVSFVLRLRSWNDIKLVERPPWWTPGKMLWLLLGSTGVAAVGLLWGMGISRKNKLLKLMQTDLQTANNNLELRVQDRTHELEKQVVSKERARAALFAAQKNLIITSRKAGMAEVATGILHNVGNVLNSVNVSVSLLADQIQGHRVEGVVKAAKLLQRQPADLSDFLLNDPKGVQLPAYLQTLGEHLIAEKHQLRDEIGSLAKNVEHIKIVVAMQQDYAKVLGVFEELNLEELLEDAIRINGACLEHDAIQLTRDYQPLPRVVLDRHKVLQILVNLLSNAKHALAQKAGDKKIIVRLALCQKDRVCVSIIDNGIGIAADQMQRIFSPGFTTRKEGHGYGLHNAANAAKELGGSLNVKSDGQGHGAAFTLELPATRMGMSPSIQASRVSQT
jgi:signal transduction histidine kinase